MSRSHFDNRAEKPSARRPVRCIGGLLQTNLKAHLDGEMSAVRNWLVRWHLAQCPECREELRWLRRLGEDMKELESARPRPELRARILANLPAAPPTPGIRVVLSRPDQGRSPRFAPRPALAGGLATLLAFSGVFALKHTPGAVSNVVVAAQGTRPHPVQNGQPEETSPAGDTTPEVMATLTYHPEDDPNNALADKMFHDSMNALEREKLVQGQDDWHRLLSQARAAARKTDRTAPTEMGIALTVSNIAAVRTHLPTWAKQEGARLVTNGRPDAVAAENGDMSASRPESSSNNLIAFYVPAERGPAFLGALKQLGQISALPLSPNPAAVAGMKSADPVQAEPNANGPHAVIPSVPTADAGVPTDRSLVAHEKHTKAARYLILTVLLQPAPN